MFHRFALAAALTAAMILSYAPPAAADNPTIRPWIGAVEAYQAPEHARAIGIGWQRVNFWWNEIQATPADWNLTPYAERDGLLARDRADGIKTVGLIGNPPTWATSNGSVPKNLDLPLDHPANYWARFVERLTARYAGEIDEWIIWNEPDFDLGQPANTWAGSDGDYRRLLRVAYLAAKRANPKAKIVFAGTTYWADASNNRRLFLERVLDDTRRNDPDGIALGYYFDAVSIHVYSTPEQLYTIPRIYREVLGRFGLDKPLWISEANVVPHNDPIAPMPPGGFRASLNEQADFFIQGLALSRAAGVERVAVYKLSDGRIVGGEAYGLVRNDQTRRPAFAALQTVSRYLGDFGRASYEQVDEVDYVTFKSAGGRTTVFWNANEKPRQSRIRAVGARAQLVHRDGRVESIAVPTTPGDSFFRLPLPGATAEAADLQPGYYFIGGEPLILIEEAIGEAVEVSPNRVFYPITGHSIANGFLDFFRRHGGLDTFGYPRTEEIVEGGRTVQYFQRARLEWVPEAGGGRIELGLLNDLLRPTPPSRPVPAASATALVFPETGHGVEGIFRRTFEARGGLEIFGYPTSAEIVWPNGVRVQHFQRMRLEQHPEHAGTPAEVQLGLVGDEYLQQVGRLVQ